MVYFSHVKTFIYSIRLRKKPAFNREKLIEFVFAEIERQKIKVAEIRGKALLAYANDDCDDICKYTEYWHSCRISLGSYKAKLKALQNPEVKGRFSYERMLRRYAKQNLIELPLDFEMEQAKRAYEQRKEEAEQWLDNNFTLNEQMDRLLSGRNYANCPIGNFEAVEQYYQAMKS